LALAFPVTLPEDYIYFDGLNNSLINFSVSGKVAMEGPLVNSNTKRPNTISGSVVIFDFSWRSLTLADELIRAKRLNATAAITTTSLSMLHFFCFVGNWDSLNNRPLY
jgi:hypothetical protein